MTRVTRPPVWPAIVIAAIAFLFAQFQLQTEKPWNPVSDELQYLSYGHTLALTGQFAATVNGPQADSGPGREPLYSALIAAIMQIDPVLKERAGSCIGNDTDPTCPPIYRSLRWANTLLIAATAMLAYLAAQALGGGAVVRWTTGLYIALNLEMMKSVRYVISDYLSMALTGALILTIALALKRRKSVGRWASVGALTGLLILTKGIYELYAAAGIACALAFVLIRRDRASLTAFAAATIAVAVLTGAWVVRNDMVFGRPVLTDARGAIALSTREELDHMTAGEYGASFLWWMRGPGPGIARAVLPERDYHRLDLYAPDGFYMMGQVTNYEKRVQRLMDERGLDHAAAEGAASSVIVREILGDFPRYVATTLPVFYRGLWFDEFVVFGFPALVWLVIRAIRRRDGVRLAVLAPAVFSLVAYALLSLNISRYQYTAITGLALASGVAVEALWPRLRGWTAWRGRKPAA